MNTLGLSALAALIALPLGYVLPGDRVLDQVERRRESAQPLRVEAELSGVRPDWPGTVVFELHPRFGLRVSAERGDRWVFRKGRLLAGPDDRVPAWVPDLEILVARGEDELRRWLDRDDVDLTVNELGRCGESDCFVLGGRRGRGQVWVDKDSFEIVRWVSPWGRTTAFATYTDWDGLRFPETIELQDRKGVFATLVIVGVTRARDLRESGFSREWVDAATRPGQ